MLSHYLYSLALATSIACVTILKKAAVTFHWVDRPDDRKRHHGEIPVIGGIAMYVALVICSFFVKSPPANYKLLLNCLFFLVLFGTLDDKLNLSSRLRLLIQALTVLAMSNVGGITLTHLGNLLGTGDVVLPHWLAIPFTVFCAVGIINAFNMIDGLDGLAGGLSLVAISCFSGLSFATGLIKQGSALMLLAFIIAGFLVFNMRHPFRKRASVFMGDAGSTMLGFTLAWFAINLTQKHFAGALPPKITPITTVWILAVPLMDTITVMTKRILRKKSPFSAGRDHLHHMLLDHGFSDAQVVHVILLLSIVTGLLGLIGWTYQVPEANMFYGFIGLFCVYLYLRSTRRKRINFIPSKSKRL